MVPEGKEVGMRTRRGMKRVVVVVALLLVVLPLLAAACGEEGEGLLKRELPANASPEKIMLEGLNATDEVRSIHYLFDYSIIIPPTGEKPYTTEINLQGEGDYDAATGNAQAHVTWPAFEVEYDYCLYDGKQYFRSSLGGNWYELPENYGFTVPTISEITRNTSEYMDNFQKISRLDDQEVGGRDCYHIALVPNFDAIMENEQFLEMLEEGGELDEETRARIEEMKEKLKDAAVDFEYWIDKEYLVFRRTLYTIELVERGDETTPPYTVKLVMEMDFPVYNLPVSVSPPGNALLYKDAGEIGE